MRLRRLAGTRGFRSAAVFALLGVLLLLGNLHTTTRIGIDEEQHTLEMPLYQKLIAFIDRDLQMHALADRVVGNTTGAEATAMRILEWSNREVRPVPPGFPVVDDHPINIVIRGYGSFDQAADVFANIAAYSGIPAKFVFSRDREGHVVYAFALAEIDGAWRPFDVREGRAFRLPSGALAAIDDVRADPSLTADLPPPREAGGIPYPALFQNIDRAEARSIYDQMLSHRLQNEARRLLSFGR